MSAGKTKTQKLFQMSETLVSSLQAGKGIRPPFYAS